MNIDNFMKLLEKNANEVEFEQSIELINEHFNYQPSAFENGPSVKNEAGTNEGSCKIFALGLLLSLTESQTLACFGRFYREDVLLHPNADNHANIRAFMAHGWEGIHFEQQALTRK